MAVHLLRECRSPRYGLSKPSSPAPSHGLNIWLETKAIGSAQNRPRPAGRDDNSRASDDNPQAGRFFHFASGSAAGPDFVRFAGDIGWTWITGVSRCSHRPWEGPHQNRSLSGV